MKRFALIAVLVIIGIVCVNHAYDAAQTRLTPRATLGRNFELVWQEVQGRFPREIIAAEPYSADNGYLMSFEVRAGTTPAEGEAVIDDAYPRLVMIRRWAGMGEHAPECVVLVFDPTGKMVTWR